MSTIRKGITSFVAVSTIASFLRVKYTNGNQIDIAGATDKEVGVTTGDKTSNAIGTPAPVQLLNEPGTVLVPRSAPTDVLANQDCKCFVVTRGIGGIDRFGHLRSAAAAGATLPRARPHPSLLTLNRRR